MDKQIMASASYYTQKYYMNQEFEGLPTEIRNEIRIICIHLAEKLHGIFTIGFYGNGEVFLQSQGEEVDYDYDEIGATLEIKKLEQEHKELIRALQMWYVVYKTAKRHEVKKMLK